MKSMKGDALWPVLASRAELLNACTVPSQAEPLVDLEEQEDPSVSWWATYDAVQWIYLDLLNQNASVRPELDWFVPIERQLKAFAGFLAGDSKAIEATLHDLPCSSIFDYSERHEVEDAAREFTLHAAFEAMVVYLERIGQHDRLSLFESRYASAMKASLTIQSIDRYTRLVTVRCARGCNELSVRAMDVIGQECGACGAIMSSSSFTETEEEAIAAGSSAANAHSASLNGAGRVVR